MEELQLTKTTTIEYYENGNKKREVVSEEHNDKEGYCYTEINEYNEDGLITECTEIRGNYDLYVARYFYDMSRNLIRKETNKAEVTEYDYDKKNRIIRGRRYKDGNKYKSWTNTYFDDKDGSYVVAIVYSDGTVDAIKHYNRHGDITDIYRAGCAHMYYEYEYDEFERITKIECIRDSNKFPWNVETTKYKYHEGSTNAIAERTFKTYEGRTVEHINEDGYIIDSRSYGDRNKKMYQIDYEVTRDDKDRITKIISYEYMIK